MNQETGIKNLEKEIFAIIDLIPEINNLIASIQAERSLVKKQFNKILRNFEENSKLIARIGINHVKPSLRVLQEVNGIVLEEKDLILDYCESISNRSFAHKEAFAKIRAAGNKAIKEFHNPDLPHKEKQYFPSKIELTQPVEGILEDLLLHGHRLEMKWKESKDNEFALIWNIVGFISWHGNSNSESYSFIEKTQVHLEDKKAKANRKGWYYQMEGIDVCLQLLVDYQNLKNRNILSFKGKYLEILKRIELSGLIHEEEK